ncbi:MAG: MerR family transcriptional regulator [Rhodobacteraceae bacterium]|nr:MerR family transcriptional regulator [Paracoccaceae bacterium]
MAKSAQAFRTIREVADWLGVEAHVLRFWESKFPQIKPVKRAGGRRYYRPADMQLIGGIKVLLHDEGYTIRGVQRLIKEDGQEAVTAKAPPLDEGEGAEDAATLSDAEAWAEDDARDAAEADTDAETTDPDQAPLPFDTPAPRQLARDEADEAVTPEAEPEADAEPASGPDPAPTVPGEDGGDGAGTETPDTDGNGDGDPAPEPEDAPAGDPLTQLADLMTAARARPRKRAEKALGALIETMRKDPVP